MQMWTRMVASEERRYAIRLSKMQEPEVVCAIRKEWKVGMN